MEFGTLEGTTRFRENPLILEEVQDARGESLSWCDFAGLLHRPWVKSREKNPSLIEYDVSGDSWI